MTPMEQQFIEVAANEFVEWRERTGTYPTPQAEIWAAVLYGMLRASNGMVALEEIVKAALNVEGFNSAAIAASSSAERGSYLHDWSSGLFRAIAVEALGGAKVSEEFGEIWLVAVGCCATMHPPPCTRLFSVPPLVVEGARP